MIQHYLTIAFRNLWKYKAQNLIGIFGLAVGFICFALATLWVRYEMTYDSFHAKADRIYRVYAERGDPPYPLAAYLKENIPEITNAINLKRGGGVRLDGVDINAHLLCVDAAFLSMFDVRIIEGNADFTIFDSTRMAITQEKAQLLFGNESPLGKRINYRGEDYTICAVVDGGWATHTNYPFDFLIQTKPDTRWNIFYTNTLIEVAPNIDIKALKEKLYKLEFNNDGCHLSKLILTPLTTMYYEDPGIQSRVSVKFREVTLFALIGALVILCALFNYLTLFVSRFRIRSRELALRVVCGASNKSLFALLSVEFLILLLTASIIGLALMQAVLPTFLRLSNIQYNWPTVYGGLLAYIGIVIAISLLVFLLVLRFFRRQTLNAAIHRNKKGLLRKASIIIQLIISIGFIFCTTVMMKQLYFLHHTTDIGFSYKNRAAVSTYSKEILDALENQLKQIPEITETLRGYAALLPMNGRYFARADEWDDKLPEENAISLERIFLSKAYADFYELQLASGEALDENEPEGNVLINETAAKTFGWTQPIGKSFTFFRTNKKIKGVLKDIYNFSLTTPVVSTSYEINSDPIYEDATLLFKYREGQWKICKNKIEQLLTKKYPDLPYPYYRLTNAEEEYDKYFSSETTLLKLLGFVSLICIIISIFGFFSLISLTCEERRKEIAIRKVNGATAGNILYRFIKEYFILLAIGVSIAFPTAYFIMKKWIENYTLQTTISIWIYAAILVVFIVIIVLCVGLKVYKTSRENPAEAVKKE